MSAQQVARRGGVQRAGPKRAKQQQGTNVLEAMDSADKAVSRVMFDAASTLVPRSVFILLEEGGDGFFWIVGTLLLFFWPGLPAYERTVVANLFVGLMVDLAFIGCSKALFRRPRPQYNATDMHVVAAVDMYSFPSGHASRVGFVISYIYVCYHINNPTIVAAVLAWGVLTALSRALMGRHYVGDVAAGLCLGMLTTTVLTKGTWSAEGLWVTEAAAAAANLSATAGLRDLLARSGLGPRLEALTEHYGNYLDSLAYKAGGGGGVVASPAAELAQESS